MSDHQEKYAAVQQSLLKLHSKRVPWTFMSKECGLSANTIKKFANNETYSPQFRTVDMLADYAGFRLAISDLQLNTPIRLRRIK